MNIIIYIKMFTVLPNLRLEGYNIQDLGGCYLFIAKYREAGDKWSIYLTIDLMKSLLYIFL